MAESEALPADTECDLRGKVCIVTGANTGIGRVTALELARAGAHVFLLCRSRSKAEPVVAEIRQATDNDLVEMIELDLSSLSSVRRAAETFLARELELHVLVNNAGLGGHHGLTEDGFEVQFGVNYVGHWLLTELLLDRIKASAPARIVIVASGSHYQAKGIDFGVLRKPTRSFTAMNEYEVSKLANVLHARELAARLQGTGVTTYALNPGRVASDIWRNLPAFARWVSKPWMLTNEEGAQTSLLCATSTALAHESGLYYDRCQRKPASAQALNDELMQRLHVWSLEAVRPRTETNNRSAART